MWQCFSQPASVIWVFTMGAVREYFKDQFRWRMLGLKCDQSTDYSYGLWRTQSSVLPVLLIRVFLFLLCLAIIIASLVLTISGGIGSTWAIFMTHWGLIVNTLACGFAVAVSTRCYLCGPLDTHFESLPWYFPTFWAFYNIAVTVSFLITIFYWAFLTDLSEDQGLDVEFAVDKVLDVFIHAINSVATVLLLVTSALPAKLLHVLYPVGFGIVYLIFTAIFYAAGGLSPFGTSWIYPTLDWTQPGVTMFFVVIVLILLLLLYGLVIGMTVARDAVTRTLCKNSIGRYEEGREEQRWSTDRSQMHGLTDLGSPVNT